MKKKSERISRQEAIENGLFFDVPDFMLKHVGITIPTGVTNNVLREVDEYHLSRLVALLQVMALEIVASDTAKSVLPFVFEGENYMCLCGPGDDGKSPAFTVVKVKYDMGN
jgi:hypothetical protein